MIWKKFNYHRIRDCTRESPGVSAQTDCLQVSRDLSNASGIYSAECRIKESREVDTGAFLARIPMWQCRTTLRIEFEENGEVI